MKVGGFCDAVFERVLETFVGHFDAGLEAGASVCVTREGQAVVDLWAGVAGPDGAPWQRDTIVNVYSTTKTMAAIPMLMLADRGQVDLQAPVADYWPDCGERMRVLSAITEPDVARRILDCVTSISRSWRSVKAPEFLAAIRDRAVLRRSRNGDGSARVGDGNPAGDHAAPAARAPGKLEIVAKRAPSGLLVRTPSIGGDEKAA